MNHPVKKSRCAFVVIKLRVAGKTCFLMRQDTRWNDLNFIGGHEKARDAASLKTVARRELLEEVPYLRSAKSFELAPLTTQFVHGPVYSRSAGCDVEYELQFFCVKFETTPEHLLESLGPRSANKLVCQDDLILPSSYRVSKLVQVLSDKLREGFDAIPFSWPEDVGASRSDTRQMDLPLGWPGASSQYPDRGGSGSRCDQNHD